MEANASSVTSLVRPRPLLPGGKPFAQHAFDRQLESSANTPWKRINTIPVNSGNRAQASQLTKSEQPRKRTFTAAYVACRNKVSKDCKGRARTIGGVGKKHYAYHCPVCQDCWAQLRPSAIGPDGNLHIRETKCKHPSLLNQKPNKSSGISAATPQEVCTKTIDCKEFEKHSFGTTTEPPKSGAGSRGSELAVRTNNAAPSQNLNTAGPCAADFESADVATPTPPEFGVMTGDTTVSELKCKSFGEMQQDHMGEHSADSEAKFATPDATASVP